MKVLTDCSQSSCLLEVKKKKKQVKELRDEILPLGPGHQIEQNTKITTENIDERFKVAP